LQCFDAVVPEAAFSPLRKSCGAQPTVFATVKSLEVQFGLTYFIEGAQSRTVGDQLMKKRIIVQGAAWGHLHHFLIEQELHDGRLLSIPGGHLRGAGSNSRRRAPIRLSLRPGRCL
jgi:hypothetical protein